MPILPKKANRYDQSYRYDDEVCNHQRSLHGASFNSTSAGGIIYTDYSDLSRLHQPSRGLMREVYLCPNSASGSLRRRSELAAPHDRGGWVSLGASIDSAARLILLSV